MQDMNEQKPQLVNPVISRFMSSCVNGRLPLVSVVITNFNYERFLENCLESVRNQDYKNIECIIVDDKSTDDSVSLVQGYLHRHDLKDSFRLMVHEENAGQLEAFATGYRNARGSFIVFVDADDILLEDFISAHLDVHLGRPPVAFTCSMAYGISADHELRGFVRIGNFAGSLVKVPSQAVYTLQWPWSCTSSMMFRKSVLEYVFSGHSFSYRYCADLYLCHFANLLGGSMLIPGAYTAYRMHETNQFQTNPIVGDMGGIGDMRRHPDHNELLDIIRERLFDNREKLVGLMGMKSYLKVITRVTPITGLWKIFIRLPSTRQFAPGMLLYLPARIILANIAYHYFRIFRPLSLPKTREIH